MYDNVCDKLSGDASTMSDVNIDSTAINGFEAVHDELLFELDHHAGFENNPKRLGLDYSMPQSARTRVDDVMVAGIGDHVESTVTATNGIPTESDSAVG